MTIHSTYRITNLSSGLTLGDYPGTTEEEALEAMAHDAGYDSYEHCCAAAGRTFCLAVVLVPCACTACTHLSSSHLMP